MYKKKQKKECITWQAIMGELIVKWEKKLMKTQAISNKQKHVEREDGKVVYTSTREER
jgi:hypothetical protein